MNGPRYAAGANVRLVVQAVEQGIFPIAEIRNNGSGWYYRLDDGDPNTTTFWPEGNLEPLDQPEARYTLYTAADALQPQPPIDWVIENLFSVPSVSLMFGDPGCGKTFAALDACVCVALGNPWLTYSTQQSAVLIVDEESGPRRLARRLGDVLRGHSGDATTPISYTTLARFDLRKGDDIQALLEAITTSGARFVVIDALVDVMPGADENAVADVHPIFVTLRDLAEATQAAIVVIHHSSKAGGYRGSSAMNGAVDMMLQVAKKGDELTFKTVKPRDVEPFDFGAIGNWQPGTFWLTSTAVVPPGPTFTRSQKYVMKRLRDFGPCALQEIMDNADTCSGATAKTQVYKLTADGYLERTNQGGKGDEAIYNLTPAGRLEAAQW